jgi:hypothetical protein
MPRIVRKLLPPRNRELSMMPVIQTRRPMSSLSSSANEPYNECCDDRLNPPSIARSSRATTVFIVAAALWRLPINHRHGPQISKTN